MLNKTLSLLMAMALCSVSFAADSAKSITRHKESQSIGKQQSPRTHNTSINKVSDAGRNRSGKIVSDGDKARQTLSAAERGALAAAIQDEYKARDTYANILADFGQVRPFSNIIHAEKQHIEALSQLFRKYNLPVPPSKGIDKKTPFTSLSEACAIAVQAERDNVVMYDALMKATDKPDLLGVFSALRRASLENHLPAFLRCSSSNTIGQGQGWRGGWSEGNGNRLGRTQNNWSRSEFGKGSGKGRRNNMTNQNNRPGRGYSGGHGRNGR